MQMLTNALIRVVVQSFILHPKCQNRGGFKNAHEKSVGPYCSLRSQLHLHSAVRQQLQNGLHRHLKSRPCKRRGTNFGGWGPLPGKSA